MEARRAAPAAANVSAISSISPIQRQPFARRRRARRAASRSASSGADSRHSACKLVLARRIARATSRIASSSAAVPFDHAAYAIFSARGVGDDTRVDDRAGEQRRRPPRASSPERYSRSCRPSAAARRRCRRRRTAACSAATSRARVGRDRVRVDVEPVEAGDRARDLDAPRAAGRPRGPRSPRAASAGDRAASRNAAARDRGRVAAALGGPQHLVPVARRSASPTRRAHLARVQQPDDHSDVGEHEGEERDRDHAVHREERRVEPAQVARPDERVLVGEQRRRRSATPSQ